MNLRFQISPAQNERKIFDSNPPSATARLSRQEIVHLFIYFFVILPIISSFDSSCVAQNRVVEDLLIGLCRTKAIRLAKG